MAAEQPGQLVRVIVQKSDDTARAEAEVERLGGQILLPLNIINAFVAEMPASAARQVALQPGVRWVSPDARMEETQCTQCISTTNLQNAYIKSIRADKVWNASPYRQGKGIGVAVVDSGINWQADLYTVMGQNRVVANVRFNTDYNQTTFDNFGHGSHIAGVVGGNGRSSNGKYIGVAPLANIINVKVSNDDGSATASSVVAGVGVGVGQPRCLQHPGGQPFAQQLRWQRVVPHQPAGRRGGNPVVQRDRGGGFGGQQRHRHPLSRRPMIHL